MNLKRLLLFERFVSECMLIYPLYSLMFADRGQLDTSMINILFALWTVTALVMEMPSGLIADHFPRKFVLMASHILRTAAFVVWLVYPDFSGFAAGFMIWSVGYTLHTGTYQAFVYDELTAAGQEARYIEFMSQATSAGYVGMIVANVVAFFTTSQQINYEFILAISIIMSLLAAALTTLFPRAKATPKEVRPRLRVMAKRALYWPHLRRTIVWLGLLGATIGWFEEYIPLFDRTIGIDTHWVPLALAFGMAIGVFANWLTPRIARLGGGIHVLMFAGACGILILASRMQPLVWPFVGGILFLQILNWLRFVFDADLQRVTPSYVRASMTSIATLISKIMGIGVALGFAWAAHRFGDLEGLRYLMLLLLIAGVLLLAKKPTRRHSYRYYCVPGKIFR